jgi:hypothetical protein
VDSKPGSGLKHFIFAFIIAVVGYVVVFQFIERQRDEKGPWQVIFTSTSAHEAMVVIDQANLAISNVRIVFPDSNYVRTGAPVVYTFNQPTNTPFALPFGECKLMDLRFLPGTVVFHAYGHEIQLLGRALVIDDQEHPWKSDSVINLHPR